MSMTLPTLAVIIPVALGFLSKLLTSRPMTALDVRLSAVDVALDA